MAPKELTSVRGEGVNRYYNGVYVFSKGERHRGASWGTGNEDPWGTPNPSGEAGG